MSLGSYVYRKSKLLIGHLIATPQVIPQAPRAGQPSSSIDQTRRKLQTLPQGWRIPSTSHLSYYSYCVLSKAEGIRQIQHGCSTVRPTFIENQWFPSVDNQTTASPEKQHQHISTIRLRAPYSVQTLENPDQIPSKKFGKQPRNIQRAGALNRKLQRHREIKDRKRELWRKKSTWSQDWQVPLSLLKLHYKPEHECTMLWGPQAAWSNPQKIIRQVRVDQIPRPQVWSVITFKSYVEDLTRSTVDRLVQRQIYGNKGSHVNAVANVLEKLFQDTGMKSFLSLKACNIALHFFYESCMISKARVLVTYMEKLHLKLEPETFDIILRGSAANKDLHNYTYHLQSMIKRGYKPNPRTWSSLLMAVDSSEARASIVQAMRERKMLKSLSVSRDVVDLTIRDEVAKHIDGRKEMSALFTAMDTRYAPGWLTVSGANIILDEISMRQSAWQAFDLLKEIRNRVSRLDKVSLNTLLSHCSHIRAHDLTIDVLNYFEVNHSIIPAQKEYEVLFKQAWRSRLYNFAKVIWRSACMDTAVTFKMQKLVMESLTFEMPDRPGSEPKSRADIWKAAAGKVVVGVELAAKESEEDDMPQPGTTLPNPVQDLDKGKENLAGRLSQPTDHTNVPRRRPQVIHAARNLYHSDLTAFQKWHLERKLAPLLREALAMDREWAKGDWRNVSTEWKCRNSIPVRVKTAGLVHEMIVRRCKYTP